MFWILRIMLLLYLGLWPCEVVTVLVPEVVPEVVPEAVGTFSC